MRNCGKGPKYKPRAVFGDCQNLGDPLENDDGTPATELVPCGCGGDAKKERPASVFECLLFTECLPLWRPSAKQRQKYESRPDAIRLCDGCPRGAE